MAAQFLDLFFITVFEFFSSVVLPCAYSLAKNLLFALSAIAITWLLNKIKMQFVS